MDIIGIFIAIIILSFVFVMLSVSGRNFLVRAILGKIIRDYGSMDRDSYFGFRQKIRILKCAKKGETFYVLETELRFFFLSYSFFYTKISYENANKLIEVISNKS